MPSSTSDAVRVPIAVGVKITVRSQYPAGELLKQFGETEKSLAFAPTNDGMTVELGLVGVIGKVGLGSG